jgi:hypothetical protein
VICEYCGFEARTKNVAFYQNVGLIFVRMTKSVHGELCKSCVHKYFWKFTLTNLFLGWWGTTSFFINPFLILNNLGRYLTCLTMEPRPANAWKPELTEEAAAKIRPQLDRLLRNLEAGERFEHAVTDTANQADVTPGQVVLYLNEVYERGENARVGKRVIRCDCGAECTVTRGQAGSTITCRSCGVELVVPSLAQWERL